MRRQTFLMTAVAAAFLTTAALEAQATTLVALTGNRTLTTIDGDTATLLGQVPVTGIDSPLVGIDVRPADGQLYGVTRSGKVVTIDPATGAATLKSTLTQPVPAGVRVAVDFNPAADRLRMVGRDRSNLRANVDTGDVTVDTNISFAQPNPFGGTTPAVIAVAYSNSVAGAPATLLWDIEDSTDALHLQLPPNDGVINAVGNKLGIVVSIVGFDIETLSNGVNRGWLIKGNVLYQVGLVSGKVMTGRPVAKLAGPVRDLAVLPNVP